MADIKWYKRDPNAALTGMMCLTLEERGAYNTALDLIYAHGGQVLDDDRFLAGWMRCDVRVWKRIKATLIASGKLYLKGTFLRNCAADRAVDDALHRIGSARQAGDASAAKRAAESSKVSGIGPTAVERPLQQPTTTTTTTAEDSGTKVPSSRPAPRQKRALVTLDELSVDHIAVWLAKKRGEGKYAAHDEHFILEFFKSQCSAKGYKYDDYVSAYRNAFEWDRCQPRTGHGAGRPGGQRGGAAQVAGGAGTPQQSSWLAEGDRLAAKYRAEAERERQGTSDPDPG